MEVALKKLKLVVWKFVTDVKVLLSKEGITLEKNQNSLLQEFDLLH